MRHVWESCDRCIAEAKHVATKGTAELLFCDHHLREGWAALFEQGWDVKDADEGERCSVAVESAPAYDNGGDLWDGWSSGMPVPPVPTWEDDH